MMNIEEMCVQYLGTYNISGKERSGENGEKRKYEGSVNKKILQKNNHDCNNIKQKAEPEIANLKLEIEKLNFRKNNMNLLLNYFNSKNTKNSSKGVKLDDQS
ncbi:uncharacterized protein LOC132937195 isoform X1 [Metopolophium dirhodum]|uniref:uncharacterized protein LOC132937195 isoform X1 n=1 Tax=Metopolophium dirhodum TaxID=44670 RepID=UPI00298FE13A|nr:uncharacterized protein LOC132937195 isoform X1 [Metopolophium dirhodum]